MNGFLGAVGCLQKFSAGLMMACVVAVVVVINTFPVARRNAQSITTSVANLPVGTSFVASRPIAVLEGASQVTLDFNNQGLQSRLIPPVATEEQNVITHTTSMSSSNRNSSVHAFSGIRSPEKEPQLAHSRKNYNCERSGDIMACGMKKFGSRGTVEGRNRNFTREKWEANVNGTGRLGLVTIAPIGDHMNASWVPFSRETVLAQGPKMSGEALPWIKWLSANYNRSGIEYLVLLHDHRRSWHRGTRGLKDAANARPARVFMLSRDWGGKMRQFDLHEFAAGKVSTRKGFAHASERRGLELVSQCIFGIGINASIAAFNLTYNWCCSECVVNWVSGIQRVPRQTYLGLQYLFEELPNEPWAYVMERFWQAMFGNYEPKSMGSRAKCPGPENEDEDSARRRIRAWAATITEPF